jgi:hypothetical protein
MKTSVLTLSGAAGLLAMAAVLAPAQAIPRTFVSGTGGGAACTRAAPCATFQAAHNATDPGGEVNCVDAGEYGELNITKSITIDCTGTSASITFSMAGAQTGVFVGGPSIVVRLRHLTIRGQGFNTGAGINFLDGAALFVENCAILDGSGSDGIKFRPSGGGTARLFVSNTVISGNSAAIAILPTSTSAFVVLDRVRMEKNTDGILASGSGSPGQAVVQARNSVVTGNVLFGIFAGTDAGSTTSVTLDRSAVTLNGQTGIEADRTQTFVTLGRSTVSSNVTGLGSAFGGAILSYQDNHLSGNATDGAPTAVLNPR